MSGFQIEGVLHKKYETQQKTESFQAREFVIKTGGNTDYPQFIKFQLTQDRCQVIDGCNEGETITVHFDLRGREWNDKYFTNLNAWRIDTNQAAPDPEPAPKADPTGIKVEETPVNPSDDLPF